MSNLWNLWLKNEELIELVKLVHKLDDLAERWDETTEWHDPPFLEGKIHITTGDLRNISLLVKAIKGFDWVLDIDNNS